MTTLTLQPAESAIIDTCVYSGAADTSYATGATFVVRQYDYTWNSLMLWDLSPIPEGAIITSAVLTLTASYGVFGEDWVINLHRILAANSGWVEACTWNYADGAGASQTWAGHGTADGCNVAGTDYASDVFGTTTIDVVGEVVNQPFEFTLDLDQFQLLRDGNYGILVRSAGPSTYPAEFHSSSAETESYRPKLVITYTQRTFQLGPHSSSGSAMAAMPYPTAFPYSIKHTGGEHYTSASLYQDSFDRRHTWQYQWRMLTAAELATLKTEFDRDTTLDMSPTEIDDTTYYQVVITSGFDANPVHTGTVGSPYFDLALTFQET